MARLGDYNIRRIIFAILAVTGMVVIFSFSEKNQKTRVLRLEWLCVIFLFRDLII